MDSFPKPGAPQVSGQLVLLCFAPFLLPVKDRLHQNTSVSAVRLEPIGHWLKGADHVGSKKNMSDTV